MILATTCAGCRELCPSTLCRRCRFALASVRSVRVDDDIRAALPFEGLARDLVLALKYRGRRYVARVLAQQIERRLHLDEETFDLVTWAPTSARRAGERGFDQAELLARAIARSLRVPCRRTLYRERRNPAQTGRSRPERLAGPRFRARPCPRGERILVVDDVVTTGATLHAAQHALRAAGAGEVTMVAVTAVAPHRSRRVA